MAKTRPIAQPAGLRAQLGGQEPVIAHLVQHGQDIGHNSPGAYGVLEELPHHRQGVVHPARSWRPPLTSPRTDGRSSPQVQYELAQLTGAVLLAATAPFTPAQEPSELPGIHPSCRLGTVTTEAQVEQERIGHRHLAIAVIDHRPVRPAIRQHHPERSMTSRRVAGTTANGTMGHVGDSIQMSCLPR